MPNFVISNMNLSKTFAAFVALGLITSNLLAQDIVVISDGNFVRGTIQGTDYSNVAIKQEDDILKLYKAKDIKEFIWNGETYVSKPVIVKKNLELRFFKLIEHGAVNLYSIGGKVSQQQPVTKRTKVRPSLGVGGGTGGIGGGAGVSISIGGGRSDRDEAKSGKDKPTAYYIERIGTGPMLEIPIESGNSANKNQHIKNVLLQKLTGDEDLAERIKSTESFEAKLIRAFVSAYNRMQK